MSVLAVPVALASATCFACASALQHRAASQEPLHQVLDPRLLFRLTRRPLWLAGGIADVAGLGLQTLALGLGALTVVQVLLVSGLFLAVPLEAAFERRRPRRRDLAVAALAATGLAVFLLAATPGDGVSEPSSLAWLLTVAVVGPVVAATVGFARRARALRRATYLGLATGITYGMTAGLLKACAERLSADPSSLLTGWQLYALVGIGAAGFILNQNAFQDRLAAPLVAITLADPALSMIIGVAVFHERVTVDTPRVAVLLLAAAAVTAGTGLVTAGPPIGERSGDGSDAGSADAGSTPDPHGRAGSMQGEREEPAQPGGGVGVVTGAGA
ncbi:MULTISPECIES: DMT family transporter [unclassified Frankia]|uniref:DMT family transporter n=1 Tax=unclassified Frankia TaxID=2632575 RepID=UPI002024F28B